MYCEVRQFVDCSAGRRCLFVVCVPVCIVEELSTFTCLPASSVPPSRISVSVALPCCSMASLLTRLPGGILSSCLHPSSLVIFNFLDRLQYLFWLAYLFSLTVLRPRKESTLAMVGGHCCVRWRGTQLPASTSSFRSKSHSLAPTAHSACWSLCTTTAHSARWSLCTTTAHSARWSLCTTTVHSARPLCTQPDLDYSDLLRPYYSAYCPDG